MKLNKLLDELVDDQSVLNGNIEIFGLALDSRKVKQGFVFIAVNGAKEHGLVYLHKAIENGAEVIIYDRQGSESFELDHLGKCFLGVHDLSSKLGRIADRFYLSPSKALDVIGVTGTNGKTTCSQFLLQLLPNCGVIGTLGWGLRESLNKTVNTTPDALAIQEMLADFVNTKMQKAVLEVSSHGLQQGRVNEVVFKGAVFTNLSRDHLDYHGTMEEYLQAKLMLFKQPGLRYAVVNIDDVHSSRFLAVIDKKVKCWGFSVTSNQSMQFDNNTVENVTVSDVTLSLNGIEFIVIWRNEKVKVKTDIVGDFNLENILAVLTVLLAEEYSLINAAKKINALVPVPGRMERFGGHGKPVVFIDYAHTPDALGKVLSSLRNYDQKKLWLVFGCGGDRDEGKRAQMGKIAETLADHVIITNDNPRFENPDRIIKDILKGCSNTSVEIIKDRELAIRTVIKRSAENDGIMIAGKGHEDYQESRGEFIPFSDQDVVKQALYDWAS